MASSTASTLEQGIVVNPQGGQSTGLGSCFDRARYGQVSEMAGCVAGEVGNALERSARAAARELGGVAGIIGRGIGILADEFKRGAEGASGSQRVPDGVEGVPVPQLPSQREFSTPQEAFPGPRPQFPQRYTRV